MQYWKASAINRLMEYDAMEIAQENLPMELQACQKEPDEPLNAMAKKGDLTERLAATRRWVEQTTNALGALTPQEQLVLRMLYITPQKGNISRLCELLGCEQATVYRRRDKALEKFTMALYGKPFTHGKLQS